MSRTVHVFLSVRATFVGAYSPYPGLSGRPNTRRGTGYKARWFSRNGTEMYVSKRCATEQEAATLAYRWLDRQEPGTYKDTTDLVGPTWVRRPAEGSAS